VYPVFKAWKHEQGVYRYNNGSQDLEGGHALLIVGCDDDQQAYIMKNSWGNVCGDDGYVLVGELL
jgi:C1A family cysteine protease